MKAPVPNKDAQSVTSLASSDQKIQMTLKSDDDLILKMQQELLSARERNRFDTSSMTPGNAADTPAKEHPAALSIQERMKRNAKTMAVRRLDSSIRGTPTQLPMWPNAVRGGPNVLLRSAFFAGIHSKKRKVLGIQTKPEKEPEGVVIAAQLGVRIKYAGTQLNQYDADVFFEALHQARRHPLGTECIFKGRPFLEAIGRSDSTLSYEDLDDSLRRLSRGTVDIEFDMKGKPYIFVGSLISTYTRDLESKLYKITFPQEISILFAPVGWTALEWEERKALKGKPLAQWLHSYYSTHAAPFPVSLAFLKEKTGTPTNRNAHFKTELKNAFVVLQEKFGWVDTWDGDRISLTKPPSGSQGRHLNRRVQQLKLKTEKVRKADPMSGMSSMRDIIQGAFKNGRGRR